MSRLPAKPSTPTDTLAPARAYTALEDNCGALRNTLRIFKDQTSRGTVPHSHVLDRLLNPLAATRARLARMGTAITSVPFRDYARAATGDRNQDPAVEVPAFLSALDQAVADIKAAVPRLFDGDDYKPVIRLDASGEPVSADNLTAGEVAAITPALDGVLALIQE